MKYINVIILCVMLLNVNCWLYIKDSTFPGVNKLNIKQADKPLVYVRNINFSSSPSRGAEKNRKSFMKKSQKELKQACENFTAFEITKNEDDAEYIIEFDFHVIDKSLTPLVGLGIIPIPGYIYTICNASIYDKNEKLLNHYQYLDTKCVIPHWAFLPLMFTPLPYTGKLYTTNWDKMIRLAFNTIINEEVFSHKTE